MMQAFVQFSVASGAADDDEDDEFSMYSLSSPVTLLCTLTLTFCVRHNPFRSPDAASATTVAPSAEQWQRERVARRCARAREEERIISELKSLSPKSPPGSPKFDFKTASAAGSTTALKEVRAPLLCLVGVALTAGWSHAAARCNDLY